MSSPSINIGINKQGKILIKRIDKHFKDHEPVFYESFILSSSMELKKDKNKLKVLKQGEFQLSDNDDIKSWFDYELYAEIKNLVGLVNDSISDTVIVNIVVSLAEKESVFILNKLLQAIKDLSSNQIISGVDIKLFVITYSLDSNNHNDNFNIKNELKELEKTIPEYSDLIKDIYYIDDRNTDKIILHLSSNWLAFALAEFFVFQMVCQTSLAIQNKTKIFGIGIIHFNEILFRSVITNKILQYKFKEEGIYDDKGIQFRDIILKCNPFISEHQNFFNEFFTKYPYSKENNQNLTANSEEYINSFKDKLELFVTDSNYTIGESKVILANLLGEDDKKLQGINWTNLRLNISDLEFDIIDYFNKYLDKENRVDFHRQKALRNKITELNQAIKNDEKSLKILKEQSTEIYSDLDISFEEGIFSVEGKRINASGYIPSPVNLNEDFYSFEDKPIPKAIDLSKYLSKVKDQGELGSCTAFPVSAVYEFAAKRNNKNVDISELFIYYNTREILGNISDDTGATLLETINSVKKHGACYSKNYPYKIESFSVKPGEEAYTEAQHQVVEKAYRVNITEKDFKHAIANGHPIIIGLKLFKSFYPKDKTGLVPFPSKDEASFENHGNHAMLIVGYNEEEKLFKIRNSWGRNFGENGYCYAPYDYIANTEFCLEAFVITDIVDLSFSEFNYDSNASFSFLNDSLIRRKVIKEYNLRKKKRDLRKVKKDYDLIALKNEENEEQIKNPLFRKQLFEDLKAQEIPAPAIPQAEPEKSNKNPWPFIAGGVFVILISLFFKSYITTPSSLIGVLGSILLITYGCKLLFTKKEVIQQPTVIEDPRLSHERELYRFEIADNLFQLFDEMNKNLIIRYKALSIYFEKIKNWQKESLETLNETLFDSPTFVVNVVQKKPLLDYIKKEKNTFLKNLPNLSLTFHENYILEENNTNEVFETLYKNYLNDIHSNIETILDISIVDYIQGRVQYPYFNSAPELNKTIQNIQKVSTPFCNIKQTTSSLNIQNYVLYETLTSHPDAKTKEFSKHRPASIKPVITIRDNKKKYVAVQVAALNNISDLVKHNF
ncbi:C1 family peptidase [Mangrovimonas cancribranchiae]|uniref:C1 family peptidase n=1 Tax=Mangrovimonas cancribranchiae TaxID=3080055 RepID=A0AAU6P902_9FLAO